MKTNVVYVVTIVLSYDSWDYYLFSTLDLAKKFARAELNKMIKADNFVEEEIEEKKKELEDYHEVSNYIYIDKRELDTCNPIN